MSGRACRLADRSRLGKGPSSLAPHTKRDVQGKLAESTLSASKPVTEQQESMHCTQLPWP